MEEPDISRGRTLLQELATICENLPDENLWNVFKDGNLDAFLSSIFDPAKAKSYPSIGDFFLKNKWRSSIIAAIRSAITRNKVIELNGFYASPSEMQWDGDGVLILECERPFEGFICKYENDQLGYAVMARDAKKGDRLGEDAFVFVSLDEFNSRYKSHALPSLNDLNRPISELNRLLDTQESSEAKYQQLLVGHSWSLGLQYSQIQSHEKFDDKNIPDFTGVRVSDGCRDIFEIKPPTMGVFRSDGEFTASFNAAWNQAERYLNFAREEADYLHRKGLRFENPKCTLICGHDLSSQNLKNLRIKQRMNPAIHLMTFDDLLSFMKSTVAFIQKMTKEQGDSRINVAYIAARSSSPTD